MILPGHAVAVALARRHRAQIEEREAERRMHEARLHVDAEQHAEPDQVDAERLGRSGEQRHDDEGELEEIEEEGEHEDDGVDDDQEADLSAGQADQQVLHPFVPVDAIEGQREDARADQDEDDEGGELGRGLERLAQQAKFSRRRAIASTSAPTAPMAPPSVGVAMPWKIVPSTRKIRMSGGRRSPMIFHTAPAIGFDGALNSEKRGADECRARPAA